jgi:hypothetical protein
MLRGMGLLAAPQTQTAQGQAAQETLIAQEDPDVAGIPRNVENDNGEIDANAEAERAMEPVEAPAEQQPRRRRLGMSCSARTLQVK